MTLSLPPRGRDHQGRSGGDPSEATEGHSAPARSGVCAQSTNKIRGRFLLAGSRGAAWGAEWEVRPRRGRARPEAKGSGEGPCGTGRLPRGWEEAPGWDGDTGAGARGALGLLSRLSSALSPSANSDSVLGLLRTHLPSHGQAASHRPSDPPGSSVIYSQVKVACPSAYVAPQS